VRSPDPIRARRLPETVPPPIRDRPEAVEPYLDDASGGARGHAAGIVTVASEAEAAALLRSTAEQGIAILPQAARSSLTGGAIPHGELIVNVEQLADAGAVSGGRTTCGAGLRLRQLQQHVADAGWYYPPVPTYQEAMIGGTASTNAGGAATFKYGVTRQWVRGLRLLLHNGDLLELERGQARARPGERFAIRLSDGRAVEVPVPEYRLPVLKKLSAGYHAADPLDLVDLFVGSEGTLGLITAVTVDLVPLPPAVVTGLLFLDDEPRRRPGSGATPTGPTSGRSSGSTRARSRSCARTARRTPAACGSRTMRAAGCCSRWSSPSRRTTSGRRRSWRPRSTGAAGGRTA
jgi:D-lactate dehydrogenase (cytochrome)